ncbi:MAG: hypothetical protein H6813_06805 [Phycisphaeraceae bacterium]|nr:hypothetical protein [Phycisphaeraceae bacterium]MCB9848644.1 hypothetical protein [Phycisphaeraceae bacterium]
MIGPVPRRPERWPGRRGLALGALALALAIDVVWAGCSIEKNYDLLSFFFDGVPNPNALPVAASAGGSPAAMRLSATYTAHQPYLDQRCVECHGSRFDMQSVTSAVCLKCHEGVREQFRHMHGPVAFGACLWCHVPHESAYPALLKGEPRAVCTQCHDSSVLPTADVSEHRQESTVSCLACHYGHGHSARYMLREDRPASAPYVEPLSAPSGETDSADPVADQEGDG